MNTLFFIFIFIWLAIISYLLVRVIRVFNRLTKNAKDEDFKSILEKILKTVEESKDNYQKLIEALDKIKKENLSNFQKIGFLRYNPFSETGGNQSFVLAVLDGNDNGFVITSLHGREATRVFAKPVKKGKEAGFEFSKEEIQAILEAQKSKKE